MRFALCVPALLVSMAHAGVTSFSIDRTQAWNIEPGPSGYFIEGTFAAAIETDDPSDFVRVSLSGPSPANVAQDLVKAGDSYRFLASAGGYPEAQLENYPLGDYTFRGEGGTLGDVGVTLHDVAPAFEGGAAFLNYDEFTNLAPGQAVSIQVGALRPRSGATHNYTTYVLSASDGLGHPATLTQGVHEGTEAFSFGLTSGITAAARPYSVSVAFHSDQVISDAGFDGATGRIGWTDAVSTSFYTEAVPEPASLAPLGAGVLLLNRRAKKYADRPKTIRKFSSSPD